MNVQPEISLLRLRGLAALLVVAGHSFHPFALNQAKYLLNPAFLVIASATVLFVLIAGILFRAIAVPRLEEGRTTTQAILRKRWAELSGPYLTVGLFLALLIGYPGAIQEGINPVFHIGRMVLNGSMAHSYWYVPFFLLLMALSPAHVWFSRQTVSFQSVLVGFGLVVSSLIHRPDAFATLGAVHSLIYYLPVFWIGLMIGGNFSAVLKWLRNKEVFLLLGFSGVIALQTTIGQQEVYLTSLGEKWGQVDLFLVQKVLFGLIFLSVFERTKHLRMPLMDWLSRHSLTIFFMHCPILLLMMWTPHVSGFYVPELVVVSVVTIVAGLQLHRVLESVYLQLRKALKPVLLNRKQSQKL